MRRAATRSNLAGGVAGDFGVAFQSMDLPQEGENTPQLYQVTIWVCLKIGYIPNEIAI